MEGFGDSSLRRALASAAPLLARFAPGRRQEAQIRDIVAHMTLAQKIGQMTQPDIRAVTPDEVRRFYIGSVLNGGGAWPGNDKHASAADWTALADASGTRPCTPTWR
jgi:beta-glucosidase